MKENPEQKSEQRQYPVFVITLPTPEMGLLLMCAVRGLCEHDIPSPEDSMELALRACRALVVLDDIRAEETAKNVILAVGKTLEALTEI